MNTVCIAAHPDDDLYFMSPDILDDAFSGDLCGTIYLTSGASRWDRYPESREAGARAAWAQMAGIDHPAWQDTVVTLGMKRVAMSTLLDSGIRLLFLRLPDGGYGSTGDHLRRLYAEEVETVWSIGPWAEPFTKTQVIHTLLAGVRLYAPGLVRHLDPTVPQGRLDLDHSDHGAAARFTLSALDLYPDSVAHLGYIGYAVAGLPDNLPILSRAEKYAALEAYAECDPIPFETSSRIGRQYHVGEALLP